MTDRQVDALNQGLDSGEHWGEVVATSASIDRGGFPDLAMDQDVSRKGEAHGDWRGDHSCGFGWDG